MVSAERVTCRFTIDAGDRIRSVDTAFEDFARENGAPELTAERLVGKSLWSFVAGEELGQLYRAIIRRVRDSDAPVVVPFRCDSPEFRRHMRLVISHVSEGTVQLDGVLVRREPRLCLGVLDSGLPRGRQILQVCSCCKRVRTQAEGWIDVEHAVVRLHLLEAESVPRLEHILCPTCGDTLRLAAENSSAA